MKDGNNPATPGPDDIFAPRIFEIGKQAIPNRVKMPRAKQRREQRG